MPSNSMKISQFITQLEAMKVAHGDIDVVLPVHELSEIVAIDGRNVVVSTRAPWKSVPRPCVMIGLWLDAQGALQPAPGAAYVTTPEIDGWTYDRTTAPVDVPLNLHRRYVGDCEGYKTGDDRWFVKDAEGRMVECVPDGILAWQA